MSFSQVLPMPPPHFGTGSDFHTSALYSPSQDYSSMSDIPLRDLLGRYSEQQTSTISPQLLPSSPPYSRGPSRQPFGLPQTPPIRNRTPIRHHRTNEPRARSSSRPDALFAYAAEMQRRQSDASALAFRSAPNSPPVHQQSEYFMPVSSTMYPTQPSYYTAPIHQPLNQYDTGRGAFGSESSSSAYFPLSRATSHDMATLNPQDALYLPNALPLTTPPLPSLASSLPSFPPTSTALESSSGDNFRILAARERPQCWDHGCNGRQFSTFSNLLRHQREKSGSAMKSICPHCGTEFTRTTARNGHMYGGKCKGKSDHSGSENGSSDEKTTQ